MNKKIIIKNKFRFTVFLLFVLSVVLFIAITAFNMDIAYSKTLNDYETYTVKSGDTLWKIAEKSQNNDDVRKLIYEIKVANNMSDSNIIIGQELKIPN